MIIECPKCKTRFDLPNKYIDENDREIILSCAICNHEWEAEIAHLKADSQRFSREELEELSAEKAHANEIKKIVIEETKREIPVAAVENSHTAQKETVVKTTTTTTTTKTYPKRTIFSIIVSFFAAIFMAIYRGIVWLLKLLIKPRNLLIIIILAILIILLFAIKNNRIPSFFSTTRSIVETTTTTQTGNDSDPKITQIIVNNSQTPTAPQVKISNDLSKLEIVLIKPINIVKKDGAEYIVAKGYIQNNSVDTVQLAKLQLQMLDSENNILRTKDKDLVEPTIAPRGRVDFRIVSIFDSKAINYVEVNFVK